MSTSPNYLGDAALRRARTSLGDATRAVDLALSTAPRDSRAAELLRSYSLVRALDNLSRGRKVGLEAEVSRDLESSEPAHSTNSLVVPWEVLARDVYAGAGASGGYLVDSPTLPAAEALRANTVVAALGANVFGAPHGANPTLPRMTAASTGYWIANETTTITESQPTFGSVAFAPKTVGAYVELSRLILLQSTAEDIVRRDVAAVVGRSIDKAALFGSGAGGEPTGLVNTAGIATFSGTSLALAGLVDAQVALGDALDDSIGVASSRAVAGLLAKRQALTGSDRALWEGNLVTGTVAGMTSRSSTALSAGALILGSWRHLNICVWGGGVEIAIDPTANFKAGIVGVRAFATVDVGATWPGAFNYASAVT